MTHVCLFGPWSKFKSRDPVAEVAEVAALNEWARVGIEAQGPVFWTVHDEGVRIHYREES